MSAFENIDVETIDCIDGFEKHKEDIAKLVSSSSSKYLSYIHTPELLVKTLNNASEGRMILVYRANVLICLIPLVNYDRFPVTFSILPTFKSKVRMWQIVGLHPMMLNDEDADPLIDLLNTINSDGKRRGLFIELLYAGSPLSKALHNCKSTGHYIPCFAKNEKSHSLILPENVESFLASFKKKRRYNLNRSLKYLNSKGDLNLIEYRKAEQVESFLLGAQKIQKASWQGTAFGQTVMHDQKSVNRFKLFAESGVLRSFILEIDSKPIAFIRGYQYAGCFFYEEIGYDPSWSEYSPGTVLNWMMFPALYDRNCPNRIEFGLGDAQYKKVFGNSIIAASRGVYSNLYQQAMILAQFQLFLLVIEGCIRRLLKTLNVDSWVRRFLRKSS